MFLSTQSRILLTEWQSLAKVIVAHSVASKEKPITNLEELESFDIENLENITFSTAEEFPNVLSEKQINTALQGPFGALIKEKMSGYATIARFRLELHLNKEDMFKNKRAPLAEKEKIPEKKMSKINFSELDRMQKELDTKTIEHNQEWLDFIHEWTEALINYLIHANVKLTEREVQDLHTEDIATELLPRFRELGMTLPQKEYPSMSFADYLILKAELAVQSALSRRHLPHGHSEIQETLKNFKPHLTTMQNQEQQLLSLQQKTTAALLEIKTA